MEYSLPHSFVHGILQARIREWVATPFSRRSSWPRDQTWVSCTAGRLCHLSRQWSPENSPVPSNKWRHKVKNIYEQGNRLPWDTEYVSTPVLDFWIISQPVCDIFYSISTDQGRRETRSLYFWSPDRSDPNKADPSQLSATNNVLHSRAVCVLEAQSRPVLCDPMDFRLPGSSVHGIFQTRILEWFPFPSPRDLPNPGMEPVSPGSPAMQADSVPTGPPGKPQPHNMYEFLSYILLPSVHTI